MRATVEKFIAIEKEIVAEKGDFILFGLFLREESPNRWDVVISAPWFDKDKKDPLDFVISKLRARLKPDEMVMLSRIILLNPSEDFVKNVNFMIRIEHGMAEFYECIVNGMHIKHAFVITSKQPSDAKKPEHNQ